MCYISRTERRSIVWIGILISLTVRLLNHRFWDDIIIFNVYITVADIVTIRPVNIETVQSLACYVNDIAASELDIAYLLSFCFGSYSFKRFGCG